jgi:hypothetical protein
MIRLTKEGEQGTHILKPIPSVSKNADQMPANKLIINSFYMFNFLFIGC